MNATGKKDVVAVDDSPIILKVLKEVLESEYNVFPFSSGMRALSFLQTRKPDMVILDVEMPDINGYQLIREINKAYTVPVIFLTSNHSRESVEKAVFYGAKDYVVKPIVPEVLLEKIHKIIG